MTTASQPAKGNAADDVASQNAFERHGNGNGSPATQPKGYRKEAEDRAGNSKDGAGDKAASRWPSWITDNLKDKHSLKMWFRCWLVTWVAIVVMLPTKSLQTLGQAAFFVCMVTVFLPANMPVFIWLMVNFTLVFGALIGWAWGCAAMAAATRARDQDLYQAQIQRVIAGSGNGNTNPEATIQAAVFQAAFLDSRSSAVYGIFLTVGSYAAAVLFAKSLKLRFAAIFMTIVLDILCTYGPLFPTTQYTLGEIFLLPIGVSLGISFAGMLFIFPETLSHIWQGKLSSLFKASQGFLKLHETFLQALSSSEDPAATVREYSAKLRGSMAGQVALFELIDGQKGFLHMEATYSALSSSDLCSFIVPIRAFTLRTFGLLAFTNALDTRAQQQSPDKEDADNDDDDEKKSSSPPPMDNTKLLRVQETEALTRISRKMRAAEDEQHVNLERDLVPVMIDSSRDLLDKANAAIKEITTWLDYTNDHRYLGQQTADQHAATVGKLAQAADDLEAALDHFRDTDRLKLIEPYAAAFKFSDETGEHILDADAAATFRLGAQSLFFCLAWCANCIEAGHELVKVTRLAHGIAIKRPRSRIWWPKGLRKLGHLLFSHKGGDAMNSLPMGDTHRQGDSDDDGDRTVTDHRDVFDEELASHEDDHVDDAKHQVDKTQKDKEARSRRRAEQRDPDALPPSNWVHRVGRLMAACYHFFWSPVGVFALRYTIAGLALWIPSVATPTSAAFSYENRGIWAIIMGQLAVSLTHGEQIFSLASRVIGTVFGALIGAAMWYISTGNGNGNPYGFGAVTAVGFLPFVFLRLYAPMQYLIATLMTFVTLILVVGYSWQDTGRLAVTVNSGIGIVVAYRRMLLVIIGIAAGVIVMLFPKPPSTRTAARLSFSKLTNKKILRLYNSIIEAWAVQALDFEREPSGTGGGGDEEQGQRSVTSIVDAPSLTHFRAEIFSAYEMLKNLQTQVAMAKLELQARGKWPAARYEQLLKTHSRMLGALGQLYAVLKDPSYNAEWRRRFAHMTALLDPSTISDICLTLSLLAQSLQTGSRLPHASMFVRERALRSFGASVAIEDRLRDRRDPSAIQPLSLPILKSRQFMTHVQGTVALMVFLGNLDEAMAIVRDLVGEEPLIGYEALQKRWQERQFLLDP